MESQPQEREMLTKMGISKYLPQPSNIGYFNNSIPPLQNYQSIPMATSLQQSTSSPYIPPPNQNQNNLQNLITKNSTESTQLAKTTLNNSFCSEKQKTRPYIDLLINTVNNLFKEGKITMKYLEEKTETKIIKIEEQQRDREKEEKSYNRRQEIKNNNKNQNFYFENIHGINGKRSLENEKRCENPFCKYIFTSNKEKIRVKINGAKTPEKILCEECCNAVENRQFCYYCGAIYREKLSDNAVWIECDYCHKWEHFECELHKGKRYSTRQELNNIKRYMCPDCANKRAEQKISDNELKKKLIKKKRKNDLFDEQSNKKNKSKDLRNLKSEKCSELLTDVMLIEAIKKTGGGS